MSWYEPGRWHPRQRARWVACIEDQEWGRTEMPEPAELRRGFEWHGWEFATTPEKLRQASPIDKDRMAEMVERHDRLQEIGRLVRAAIAGHE